MSQGSPRSGIQRVCPFKNPPHPNATKLFANWSLMKSGQTALNAFTNRNDRASLRDDVPQGKIPADLWARARDKTKVFIDDVNPEWTKALADFAAYAKAKFTELKIIPGS